MKYVRLGNSGLQVSRIALGCMNYGSKRWRPWMIEEDEARENFTYAIEHGINFFDTSNIYSLGVSEQIVGRWIRELARRDQVVISPRSGCPRRRSEPRRAQPQASDRFVRGFAAPAEDGLHRPVSNPSPGFGNPAGGNA